VTKNGVHSK